MTKIRSNIIGLLLGWAVLLIIASSCHGAVQPESKNGADLLSITDSTYQSGTGWGYKIYVDGKIYIIQPFIPAIPGKNYFKTPGDAQKVATLVIKKIENHQIPPTVTGTELRQLQIIK